jgi:hypothetical protein
MTKLGHRIKHSFHKLGHRAKINPKLGQKILHKASVVARHIADGISDADKYIDGAATGLSILAPELAPVIMGAAEGAHGAVSLVGSGRKTVNKFG